MFSWWKNRHKHSWKLVSAEHYDSITGPRTVLGYMTTCIEHSRKIETSNIKGYFTLEDFK